MSSQPALTLSRTPFIYLTAALTTGIITERALLIPRWTVILSLAALVLCAAAAIRCLHKHQIERSSLLLLSSVAASGLLLSAGEGITDPSRLKALFEKGLIGEGDRIELSGTLSSPPEEAPGAVFISFDTERVVILGNEQPCRGSIRLTLQIRDPESARHIQDLSLNAGSKATVTTTIEPARRYLNPGSPDFNDYLHQQGFDLRGVLSSVSDLELKHTPATWSALPWLYGLKLQLLRAIDSRFEEPLSGTLKAMLAGNRYFLDEEVSERLRAAATYHTLVISGFHLGVIAWLLLATTSWMRHKRILRLAIILAVIWSYALMTGLAPPVSRAAVMITAALGAPALFRRISGVNSLFLAAFVMLALNPGLVADPSFQLSFLAVAATVAIVLPVVEKLRTVGEWRPSSAYPAPPNCSTAIRLLAELLFWDQRSFENEYRKTPVRFRLDKWRLARTLSRLRIQWVLRHLVVLLLASTAIQIITLPPMLLYFNRVSLIGILLNVGAGLLSAILMITALVVLSISWLSAAVTTPLVMMVTITHDLLVNSSLPSTLCSGYHFEPRITRDVGGLSICCSLFLMSRFVLSSTNGTHSQDDLKN